MKPVDTSSLTQEVEIVVQTQQESAPRAMQKGPRAVPEGRATVSRSSGVSMVMAVAAVPSARVMLSTSCAQRQGTAVGERQGFFVPVRQHLVSGSSVADSPNSVRVLLDLPWHTQQAQKVEQSRTVVEAPSHLTDKMSNAGLYYVKALMHGHEPYCLRWGGRIKNWARCC